MQSLTFQNDKKKRKSAIQEILEVARKDEHKALMKLRGHKLYAFKLIKTPGKRVSGFKLLEECKKLEKRFFK